MWFLAYVEELFPQDKSQLSGGALRASLCWSVAYSAGGCTSDKRGFTRTNLSLLCQSGCPSAPLASDTEVMKSRGFTWKWLKIQSLANRPSTPSKCQQFWSLSQCCRCVHAVLQWYSWNRWRRKRSNRSAEIFVSFCCMVYGLLLLSFPCLQQVWLLKAVSRGIRQNSHSLSSLFQQIHRLSCRVSLNW